MLNKLTLTLIAVTLVLGFSYSNSIAGDQTGCSSCSASKIQAQNPKTLCQDCEQEVCACDTSKSQVIKMSGATMDAVFTAEALYSCPMHPEIVTEDADLKCPLCNMKLNKMTDKQVKQLQDSHPKGCVMCPIVVKGDSDTNTCATCKMKLVEIKDGGHQEHKHDVPH